MRTIYEAAMEIPQETKKKNQKKIDDFSTLKVLRMWRNKSYDETVKTFINKLLLWQLAGYVAGRVWEQIRTIVEPSLLPAELPSPTATKKWDDDYGDSVPIIPFAAPRWDDKDDSAPAVPCAAPCVLEEECK